MEHWENLSLSDLKEYIPEIGWVYEEWKDIPDFEGLYKISSFGRIKALDRTVYVRSGRVSAYYKAVSGAIKKATKDRQGYLSISLYKENIRYPKLVHRLVGVSFIENPNNLPEVNHKKGNKTDNRVLELEWMTTSDNQKHSFRELKRKIVVPPCLKGVNNFRSKKVLCKTNGKEYGSIGEAARELGLFIPHVSAVCNGKYKQIKGHEFAFIK